MCTIRGGREDRTRGREVVGSGGRHWHPLSYALFANTSHCSSREGCIPAISRADSYPPVPLARQMAHHHHRLYQPSPHDPPGSRFEGRQVNKNGLTTKTRRIKLAWSIAETHPRVPSVRCYSCSFSIFQSQDRQWICRTCSRAARIRRHSHRRLKRKAEISYPRVHNSPVNDLPYIRRRRLRVLTSTFTSPPSSSSACYMASSSAWTDSASLPPEYHLCVSTCSIPTVSFTVIPARRTVDDQFSYRGVYRHPHLLIAEYRHRPRNSFTSSDSAWRRISTRGISRLCDAATSSTTRHCTYLPHDAFGLVRHFLPSEIQTETPMYRLEEVVRHPY